MTAGRFRSIALSFSGAVESEHMHHPDFRHKGKIFATLGYPEEGWGMVRLTPAQQRKFLKKAPNVFHLAAGAWGKSGSTTVRLALASEPAIKAALAMAFKNVAAAKRDA
jgi:hypothetical protein